MARRPPDSASPAPSAPAPPADDTRRILDALRRIVRDLRRAPTEATAATGVAATLGPARLFVLQLLAEHRTLSVSDLAALAHTDPSSVSVVARELVAAGLVTRSVDPGDQRRTLLTLSATGRAAIRKAPKAIQHKLVAALEALPPARRRTLATLLVEVLDATQSDPRAPLFFEDTPKRKRPPGPKR